MHSYAKQATKDEKRRFERISELGCIACRLDDVLNPPVGEIHHLLDGGVRIGHSATVSLCQYHHRGVPTTGYSDDEMRELFGPSLAHGSKPFKERYGTDTCLLLFQEELLAEHAKTYI